MYNTVHMYAWGGLVFVCAALDALPWHNGEERSTLHVVMFTRELKGCSGWSCSISVIEVSSNKASFSGKHERDRTMTTPWWDKPACFALYVRGERSESYSLYLHCPNATWHWAVPQNNKEQCIKNARAPPSEKQSLQSSLSNRYKCINVSDATAVNYPVLWHRILTLDFILEWHS